MKHLQVSLLSPGWEAGVSQGSLPAVYHRYAFIYPGEDRQSGAMVLVQGKNATARLEPGLQIRFSIANRSAMRPTYDFTFNIFLINS